MRILRSIISIPLTLPVFLAMSLSSFSADINVNVTTLPVAIDGNPYNLEVLIAKPPGPGPLPLVLITHGSAGGDYAPSDIRAESEMQTWAMDFAHRGYIAIAVVRRGYGHSDGVVADDAGTCQEPNPAKYLDQHADDIDAVLKAVRAWPEVDSSRTIVVGQSTGGAVMLAAAARQNLNISLIINISGGLYRYESNDGPVPFNVFDGCEKFRSELIALFGRYGKLTSVPSLWLYAANDPWFTPSLAVDLRKSWKGEHDRAQLVNLPPTSINGHRMFFEAAGRRALLPEIDAFLRKNNFPTWDAAKFRPLEKSLRGTQLNDLSVYLSSGSDKALAISSGNNDKLYYSTDQYTAYRSKSLAIEECERYNGKTCRIIAHNFNTE